MELQAALNINIQAQQKSLWAERQEDLGASWLDARGDIMMYMTTRQTPPNKVCNKCTDKPAVIRCRDCRQFFCEECERITHLQFFLHDRESPKDGFFHRIPTGGRCMLSSNPLWTRKPTPPPEELVRGTWWKSKFGSASFMIARARKV